MPSFLGVATIAVVLGVFPGAGCSGDFVDPYPPGVFVSFVRPYPLVGLGCDVRIDFTPTGETPRDNLPARGCSERPAAGEAGDVYSFFSDVPPGEWRVTVSLRDGDCIGEEDFVRAEGEYVRVSVELSCK